MSLRNRSVLTLGLISAWALAVPTTAGSAPAATTGRAIAFHAGGQVVAGAARTAPVPEFFPTGRQGAEPAIGVDPAGRVFFNYVTGQSLAGTAAVLTPGVAETTNGTSFQDVGPKLGPVSATR